MMLAQKTLLEALAYDPHTGIFTWLRNPQCGGPARAGRVAGNLSAGGYIRIGIDGRSYYAHRLAWLYVTGQWPKKGIDHVSGDRHDNRWGNLREADQSLNNQNQRRAHRHNGTGLLGVEPNGSGFAARIGINGKRHYLGTFRTPEQAHAEYIAAKRRLHPGGTL